MSKSVHASALPSRPQFLKVPELAAMLKVKPGTIYEMVAQGRIPYRKPSGTNILRFDLDEILAWTKIGSNSVSHALAGYEALTIMMLMGHKDLKTTMRYIRAVQLQRNERSQHVHKLATQEIRPPVLAAVSC